MKEQTKKTFSVLTITICFTIICIVSIFSGFLTGYNKAINDNGFSNIINQEVEDFIFLCNPYNKEYYNCEGLRFMNISGLYCNNKLVCQNTLREDKQDED